MKALELANKLDKLENFYAESSLWYDHAASDAVGAASDELRRLAEVNAELVVALEKARQELDGLPRSLGYDFTHIPVIDAALAKAKEQQ